MIIKQSTLTQAQPGRSSSISTAEACFEAMRRHDKRLRAERVKVPTAAAGGLPPKPPGGGLPPRPPGGDDDRPPKGSKPGDTAYGGAAIARYLFPDEYEEYPIRCRRRVFNLWAHYRNRQERAGFFKLNGAVCLYKNQWCRFHGLD